MRTGTDFMPPSIRIFPLGTQCMACILDYYQTMIICNFFDFFHVARETGEVYWYYSPRLRNYHPLYFIGINVIRLFLDIGKYRFSPTIKNTVSTCKKCYL